MKLRIGGCKLMTEIISSEEDVEEDEVVFSRLKWLSLECLESLTSFCSGNCTFKFPSLEDLFVIDCPKVMIFSCGVSSTPRLREVRKNWGLDKGCWECNLNTTVQKLCNNESPPLVPFSSHLSLSPPLMPSVEFPSFSLVEAITVDEHSPTLFGSNKTQCRHKGKVIFDQERLQNVRTYIR